MMFEVLDDTRATEKRPGCSMARHSRRWEDTLYGFSKLANALLVEDDSEHSTAIKRICEVVDAQVGCLMALDGEDMRLVCQGFWQDGSCTESATSQPLGALPPTGIVRRIVESQHAYTFSQGEIDPFLLNTLSLLKSPPIESIVIVPVANREETVGILLAGRLKGKPSFDEVESLLLETIAAMLSLWFQNLSLRQEIGALSSKLSRVDAQLLQSAKLAATGKLAASIAHEINNPLQSVQSCIYLVADGMIEKGPNKQYLDIAREELDRIARIVQRLADLYRPPQEGRRPTNINSLLENVLALMGKRLQQSNVRVTKLLASDLPSLVVVSDQIKQVAFNLILNAVEAMPEGGDLDIISRVVRENRQPRVEIVFKDSGVGIAPEAIERIFDPFYTTKAKGTGLGLSISHDIIERHGGRIQVESTVGKGSVFTISLPVTGLEEQAGSTHD